MTLRIRRTWRKIVAAWREPIRIEIHKKRSPDWEGDAKRWRDERGL